MKTKFKLPYLVLREKGQFPGKRSRTASNNEFELKDKAGRDKTSTIREEIKFQVEELGNADIETLRHAPDVISLGPVMPMKLHRPLDIQDNIVPTQALPWGLEAVNAHQSPYTGNGVVVAVLDTGIDAYHPAFEGTDIAAKNFTNEGGEDIDGHGTHCAGTIFGKDVNRTRIGIAPGIKKALIGKVIGEGGGGSDSIINAIQWALNEGAHIISMSLGIDFPGFVKKLTEKHNLPVEAATSIALEGYRANLNIFGSLANFVNQRALMFQPTIFISASGNESQRPDWEIAVSPPAAANGIIAVGALNRENNMLDVSYFSNSNVDISAPGVSILSASPGGGLAKMSGTSMAAPHVAGVAALWAEKLIKQDALTTGALSSKLIGSGKAKLFSPDIDSYNIGTGIVQAPVE